MKLAENRQETASLLRSARRGRGVRLRALAVGFSGIVSIAGFTPYNDLVLGNTGLIGNYLPVGLLLYYLLVLLLVNAPLSRWAPRWSLNRREVAVAFAMTLVSCATPAMGLMRLLPGTLVGVYNQASTDPRAQQTIRRLALPDALFPTFESPASDIVARANEPVIRDYIGSVTSRQGFTFRDRVTRVPWAAWARPAVAWGVFILLLYGAMLTLSAIVRRQWAEAERLPFPLAGVCAALIEPPAPGQLLNPLMRHRGFQVAALSVLSIHIINGLAKIYPRFVPAIPLTYNLSGTFADPPWDRLDALAKLGTIYLSVVGISYFIPSKIAFSLWFAYVLRQVMMLAAGDFWAGQVNPGLGDQVFGALAAFAAIMLWVGRQHFIMVARQMIRGRHDGESEDPYISYPVAGWTLVTCLGGLILWLHWAGMSWVGAALVIGMVMMTVLVMARVIAQTGLIFSTIGVWFLRPWVIGVSANLPPPLQFSTTGGSYWWTNFLNQQVVVGLRETLSVYATTGLQTVNRLEEGESRRRWRGGLVLLMLVSLLLGYVTSGASHLYCEYNYAATVGTTPQSPLNASAYGFATNLLEQQGRYLPPYTAVASAERHNPVIHLGIGATVTTLLGFLSLRYEWWPLHPVGYLLWQSYPLAAVWLSIAIGWAFKWLLVRYGGARMYQAARPVFIGLIVGELGAAAAWAGVNLIRALDGYPGFPIQLLPN